MKKPSLTRTIASIMAFFIRHPIWTISVILCITGVFIWGLFRIRIDTNIFSYMSNVEPNEFVITPKAIPTEYLDNKGVNILNAIPERGEVVDIPYRSRSGLAIEEMPLQPYEELEIVEDTRDPNSDPEVGFWDGYVIVFTSDSMFTPEVLNAIYEVRDNLEKRWEIGPVLSPFDYVTVEKKGTRLSLVPISPVKDGEKWTEEDVKVFRDRLLNDSIAKNYLYTEDGSTIMLYYRARGINDKSLEELNAIVNPLRQYGRVALNGGGMINNAVMKYINHDLILLLALSFLVILVVFYLSFHSFKAMLISGSMSIIAIIWTLGAMAFAGYSLTIVTILTPCLVLTLGSSYSIHMVSEFFETIRRNEFDRFPEHMAKIAKTIFFALITTIAGFLSFLICRTSLFRDFGITIAIGVAICGLLAFTYLPALLSLAKRVNQRQMKTYSNGVITKFVKGSAKGVVHFWYVPIILTIIIFVAFLFARNYVGFDSNYMNYFPKNDPIVIDSLHFARTLGGTDPYYFTIKAPEEEKGFFLKSENLKYVYSYEQAVQAACSDIVNILSFSQYVSFLNSVYNGTEGIPENNGLINLLSRTLKQIENNIGTDVLDMLISEDGNEITLSIRNYDSVEGDLQTVSSARRLENTLDYYRYLLPEGTESRIWSSASDSLKSSDIIMEDQEKATGLSFILIFVIASIALLSIKYGFAALIPVSVGVMINYIFMWVFSIPFDIVTIGFSSIAIGAGVDDAIHFIIRYKMRRKSEPSSSTKQITKKVIGETGRAIILTTLSIDAGMLVLLFSSFKPIKYFGALMTLALTSAMLATLFVLPACIVLFSLIYNRLLRNFTRMREK